MVYKYLVILVMFAGCGCSLKASLADVKVDVPIKAEAKVNAKAEVKATGVSLDKSTKETNTVGGNQEKTEIINNDTDFVIKIMLAVKAIMLAIITMMGLMIKRMFKQLAAKDQIILDLGNDMKETVPVIIKALIDMCKLTLDAERKKET